MRININGQWDGVIIYGPEYDDLENKELYFSITIIQTKDTFTGIAIDTGGVGMNPDKAFVYGFLENNFISFTKQYQSTLITEDDGTETVLSGKPGPEINYSGDYDPSTNTFEGEWEIFMEPQQIGEGLLETFLSGTWKIKRI